MSTLRGLLERKAQAYCMRAGIGLGVFLGDGNDGAVWRTTRRTALKILERPDSYKREKDAYLRFRERKVTQVGKFHIPQLVAYDDSVQAVEMTIVTPPWLIDIGKAYVDRPPDYPPEALEYRRAEAALEFGKDWVEVQVLLDVLQVYYGIYYFDAKRANIRTAIDEEVNGPT